MALGPSSGHSGSRVVGFVVAAIVMAAASVGIAALLSRFNAPSTGLNPGATEGAPGPSRSALQAEIARRRPALEAKRAAIEEERRAIQVERKSLDALKFRIDKRRGRGLVAVEGRLDQLNMIEYSRRADALRARVTEFNGRVEAQQQAVAGFNALVDQYNASR